VAVALYEVGESKESHETSQSGLLASRKRNEVWISKIQHRNITYSNITPNRKTIRHQRNTYKCKFNVEKKKRGKCKNNNKYT